MKGTALLDILQQDYVVGINMLMNSKVWFSKEEEERLRTILFDNGFVFTKENVILDKMSPVFFEASLRGDYVETLRQVSKYDSKRLGQILNYFIENGISFSMLPNQIVNDSKLSKFILTNEQRGFIKRVFNSYGYHYKQEDEKQLLGLLGSNCATIEDYLRPKKDIPRNRLGIMDIYALEFYAKKFLSTNHLSYYRFELFQYEHAEKKKYGVHRTSQDKDEIVLYNGYKDSTVAAMIHILHHEMSHAIQFSAANNESLRVDSDLDLYLEDKILIELLDEEYYKDNYRSLSYEFDADCKAFVLDKLFFGEISKEEDRIVKDYLKTKGGFYLFAKRKYHGQYYRIDDLFLKILNGEGWRADTLKEKLYQYKLLYYKFDKDENGKYRIIPVSELKKRYYATDNKKEKFIYINLLKRKSKMAFLTYSNYLNTLKYDNLLEKKKNTK